MGEMSEYPNLEKPLNKKCIVKGCKNEATTWYPLLPGDVRFCSKHYHTNLPEKYGCDRSGPDDFDIPDDY